MASAVLKMNSLVTLDVCNRVLRTLPGGVSVAFCYGSGAFEQKNNSDPSKNMLDFILAVNKPDIWHRENLKRNWKHYSFMKYLGVETVSNLQTNYGAAVYFNTLVRVEDRLIKYGIVSTDKLIQDLLDWNSLYVSGRLHKPVLMVEKQNSTSLDIALRANLSNALHTALLLLPAVFTHEELYLTIAALSYSGDFRMTVGEDRNKVSNIVTPNLERFDELYKDSIESMQYLERSGDTLKQEINYQSCLYHLENLPRNVHRNLIRDEYKMKRYRDVEEILRELASDLCLNDVVRKAIVRIVMQSSFTQSLKGILTAGFWKSLKYSSAKLVKMAKSYRVRKSS